MSPERPTDCRGSKKGLLAWVSLGVFIADVFVLESVKVQLLVLQGGSAAAAAVVVVVEAAAAAAAAGAAAVSAALPRGVKIFALVVLALSLPKKL